jgi:DNA uptake protein ComE-like DNA-binding protein
MNRLISLLFVTLVLAPAFAQVNPAQPSTPQKLDINSAATAELLGLPAIGRSRAEWIIQTRRLNGPFRCIAELRAMPRLSEKQFQALSAAIYVTAGDTRCSPKPKAPASR